jgi:peroxiredoxin Q/BCP
MQGVPNSVTIDQPAPDFSVINQNNEQKSLADYQGNYLLLYFYPRDLTPGCTTEACNFRDYKAELKELGLTVVGVSCDDAAKHQKFIAKHDLNFELLADTEQTMVQDYGVWVEKNMYGKKYMGIQRDSFLIAPDGKVLKHYVKVKPKTHVDDVINDLKEIKANG